MGFYTARHASPDFRVCASPNLVAGEQNILISLNRAHWREARGNFARQGRMHRGNVRRFQLAVKGQLLGLREVIY